MGVSTQLVVGARNSGLGVTGVVDNSDTSLQAYHYELPPDRIAQNPVVPRDASRLLVVDSPHSHRHRLFRDVPDLLQPGDLLILNDTKVLPARLYGRKSSGAAIEILLLEERSPDCWLALVKPGKRFKLGSQLEFDSRTGDEVLRATVLEIDPDTGGRLLKFEVPEGQSFISRLDQFGQIPFPPYVTDSGALPEQYQTIYADRPGAVAAPTAGLHFTDTLFERLEQRGIDRAFVTLHVGVGTFRPVEVEDITTHQMHGEWAEVPPETAEKIARTRDRGGRVIAVGTTVVRTLEGTATLQNSENGRIQPYCGQTNLFIYPGYRWRMVDALITNFHLPRSSLLMLVSALIGRRRLLELYQDALEQPENDLGNRYRFYSFGDAMLILPEAVLQSG
ncbi:tRNA preQ1(34) S-adenosylmethionine ribosyltransferase-isomerase QueA [Lyngbya sp. CCY1209]|nr:tRNA preQ1(34) S-adenosylmethionine ribosyltransferase-isomerase QueA [Lyngbya sp. CCY1209]MEB3884760.1 tRNA preQ1(34) S-adenosylmethionine ribosyltransferase-isomerase QueA [Lyngbya sp. CCY1209]